MPEGFVTWQQFLAWLASPVALITIVQILKLLETRAREWLKKPVEPGQGFTDRYALLLTGVVAGVVQLASQALATQPAPDPMLWIAAQGLVLWAVGNLGYGLVKSARGKAGGLGK